MTTTKLCRHDMDPRWCGACRVKRDQPEPSRATFVAGWKTRCPSCDQTVHPGTTLVLTDDGWWVHRECA